MPVSGLRVTKILTYALPGQVQSFSAKAESTGVEPQFQLPRRFLNYIPQMRCLLWAFAYKATVSKFLA